jgi:hypothetical protein
LVSRSLNQQESGAANSLAPASMTVKSFEVFEF